MSAVRLYADGQRFGKWTIVEAYPDDGPTALCRCDCGTVSTIVRASLGIGQTTQCRACWYSSARQYKNGMRFGTWTVIEAYAPAPPEGQAVCQCDCGTIKRIQRGQLRQGMTKRCVRCKLAWPERLIGKKFRSLAVTEVDVDGEMVTLTCSRCERAVVRSLQYIRARHDGGPLSHPGRCPHCDVVGSPAALLRTRVTRQAIFARIKNGWTREEATTLPRGQTPERLRAQWKKRGPKTRADDA